MRYWGAHVHKTCPRQLIHALPYYIAIIKHEKKCPHRAHSSEKRAPVEGNVHAGRRAHPLLQTLSGHDILSMPLSKLWIGGQSQFVTALRSRID